MKTAKRLLRIAQVAPLWTSIPPTTYGGTERIVDLLTEALVQRGHDVTLFATGDSTTSARLRAIVPCNMIETMQKGEAYNYTYYILSSVVEALQRSHAFDLIHFHLGLLSLPLGMLSRTPTLHTIFTPPTLDDLWMFNNYPHVPVVARSHYQVKALAGDERQNIRVIYNGCDFDEYAPLLAPGQYLAFLGRMGSQKSPVDAIWIAKEVGLPIVLAGAPMNREEEVYFAEHVKPLIDGTNVKYIGPLNQSQKKTFLQYASALLFPIQTEEAFGIVMIEAMACGVPVVACNKGSVGEIIDFGQTGYYAQTREELPSLVRKALLLDRQSVRDAAMQRFNQKNMVDAYEQLYASLVESMTDTA